jgi:hypothetical protein
MTHNSHLRQLGFSARLGITLTVITLLGGLTVSGIYMAMQHENRDEQPGLTLNDIRGHYAGVVTPSPLLNAIERNHPENQSPQSRKILLDWLKGDRISEDYDSLDLGDLAPAEIIASDCLSCHSRQSTEPQAYKEVLLDYYTDIKPIAFSHDIQPVDTKILAASTHTHAISLAVLSLAAAALLLLTGWPRVITNPLILLTGAGLALDLSGWWLARINSSIVPMIVIGGFIFAASIALSLLMVIADLWRPARRA